MPIDELPKQQHITTKLVYSSSIFTAKLAGLALQCIHDQTGFIRVSFLVRVALWSGCAWMRFFCPKFYGGNSYPTRHERLLALPHTCVVDVLLLFLLWHAFGFRHCFRFVCVFHFRRTLRGGRFVFGLVSFLSYVRRRGDVFRLYFSLSLSSSTRKFFLECGPYACMA